MRALVTGALAAIGRATVAALAEAGHVVTATDRPGARGSEPGARALLWPT